MNRLSKRVSTRFFSIESSFDFTDSFMLILKTNFNNNRNIRNINIRGSKYLIKILNHYQKNGIEGYFISAIRERNTWQAIAMNDGTISNIPLNQGIIGDPYYFLAIPHDKLLIGFTTGPVGSLKSVSNTILKQFVKDRSSQVKVEHYTRKNNLTRLREFQSFTKFHFKLKAISLGQSSEEVPSFFKGIVDFPLMFSNSHISFTISDFESTDFSDKDVIEIVEFLSENDGCSALAVHGIDASGDEVKLNFSNTFLTFSENVKLRYKYIDEFSAQKVLSSALIHFKSVKK